MVKLLAELLFIRRVVLNGPAKAKLFDAVKERDARLVFAGKPIPVGETAA